jgi:hypothetical protein
VGLAQLVRFLVGELIHPDSNPRFDMCVTFIVNYSFSERRRSRRQRDTLVNRLHESQDKSTQSFECAHMNRVCVFVFIGVSAHTCMSICVYTIFLKKLFEYVYYFQSKSG